MTDFADLLEKTLFFFFQFPFGRKEHCDVHWHAVSFEENPEVYGGKVNKFPGMHTNIYHCKILQRYVAIHWCIVLN